MIPKESEWVAELVGPATWFALEMLAREAPRLAEAAIRQAIADSGRAVAGRIGPDRPNYHTRDAA